MGTEHYIDLVTDTGDLVSITVPDKYLDEAYETLRHELKTRGTWSPSQFDGCRATFLGHRLDSVNMSRIIGLM